MDSKLATVYSFSFNDHELLLRSWGTDGSKLEQDLLEIFIFCDCVIAFVNECSAPFCTVIDHLHGLDFCFQPLVGLVIVPFFWVP
jgi:hypothetical protein